MQNFLTGSETGSVTPSPPPACSREDGKLKRDGSERRVHLVPSFPWVRAPSPVKDAPRRLLCANRACPAVRTALGTGLQSRTARPTHAAVHRSH